MGVTRPMTSYRSPLALLDQHHSRPSSFAHPHRTSECSARPADKRTAAAPLPSSTVLQKLRSIALSYKNRTQPTAGHREHEVGDIWFLETSDPVRLPVLIIAIINDEFDQPAAEVAPVWTDQENATPGDLLLHREDSTAALELRVIFRRQQLVVLSYLTELLGQLTRSGESLFADALGGYISPLRTGPQLESEFDPRLSADSWMERALDLATSSLFGNYDDEDDEIEEVSPTNPSKSIFLAFELKPVRPDERSQYRLAADTQKGIAEFIRVELASQVYGIFISGRLSHDWDTDSLTLKAERVEGLPSQVTLAVSTRNEHWLVEWNHGNAATTEVTLAHQKGVSDSDVTALEVRIP